MNPNEIKTDENFSKLFPIEPDLLKKIEADMRERNYDYSQPVILAQWEGQEEPVLIDGHTRVQAAINAEISSVPVFIHEDLESEEEAKLIAIKYQCNRRNLTDAELMSFLEISDKPREQTRDKATGQFTVAQDCAPGKTAAALAETLNISTRKAEQMLTVKRHGDPDTLKAVKDGQITANKAYKETQKKRKKVKKSDPEWSPYREVPEAEVPDGDEELDGEVEDGGETVKEQAAGETDPQETIDAEDEEPEAVSERLIHDSEAQQELYKTIRISTDHYEALSQYDGDVEAAVAEAIERHLEYLEDGEECEHEHGLEDEYENYAVA